MVVDVPIFKHIKVFYCYFIETLTSRNEFHFNTVFVKMPSHPSIYHLKINHALSVPVGFHLFTFEIFFLDTLA